MIVSVMAIATQQHPATQGHLPAIHRRDGEHGVHALAEVAEGLHYTSVTRQLRGSHTPVTHRVDVNHMTAGHVYKHLSDN
jgi:hypothetical protein